MRFLAFGAKKMGEPASAVAKMLRRGDTVLITGDVGAGKTTLVKAIMKQLGWKGKVVSPTFTIVNKYELNDLTVYHLDLYRLTEQQIQTGFLSDYFDEDSISIVEWPEKLPAHLKPANAINVQIVFGAENESREVRIDK